MGEGRRATIKLKEPTPDQREYIRRLIEWEKRSSRPDQIIYRWPERFVESMAKLYPETWGKALAERRVRESRRV